MWVEGTANGEYLRRSLKTGSWERAVDLCRLIEDADEPGGTPERKEQPVSIDQAVKEYLADAKARELSEATLYKLDIFFRKQFLAWCKSEGYTLLRELDLLAVRSFRSSWKDGAMAKKKKQERLTGFFWFCIRASWITTNPTHNLGRIAVTQAPTDYFTREEFDKLVDSTYLYRESRSEDSLGKTNGTRLRTLLLLMRWSGLRIRDAITLERSRLIGDNLLLYQAKTGTPVYVPFRRKSLRRCGRCQRVTSQTRATSSGVAMVCRKRRWPTGNAAFAGSSRWLDRRRCGCPSFHSPPWASH